MKLEVYRLQVGFSGEPFMIRRMTAQRAWSCWDGLSAFEAVSVAACAISLPENLPQAAQPAAQGTSTIGAR